MKQRIARRSFRLPYRVLLILIVILAALLRIWNLDRIPAGIVADELDYVLNAKATYHTGRGIVSDGWSPFSLTTAPTETPKAELPYFVSVPFVGPFGLSLFTARIGYALISILYVLILAGIATSIFSPPAGLAAGFLAAINPWSIYFGRTAYDVPVAVTAYLAALYVLIRFRGSKILIACIPLSIGFFSYIGTKLVYLPYLCITLIGSWLLFHKRKNTRWILLTGFLGFVLFLSFAVKLHALDARQRIGQIFSPFDTSIAHVVDTQRRLTLISPFTNLFANKAVVYGKEIIAKFFGAFSPSILFTKGEGIATFSLWEHGVFYPLDALFMAVGILFLWTHARGVLFFLTLIVVSATIPSVWSSAGVTYVHRSSLMYPALTIIAGYGLAEGIQKMHKAYHILGTGVLVGLYLLFAANFAFLYFYRFPYYNSEAFGLSQRIYSRYMKLASDKNIPVTNISASRSSVYFRNYIFYSDILNAHTISSIRQSFAHDTYAIGTAKFSDTCITDSEAADTSHTYIISDTSPCKEIFFGKPMIVIPSLADGGGLYMIFNDRLCSNYPLAPYPSGFTMDDFAIENLSEEMFCEKFIIRYTDPLYRPLSRDGTWITKE